MQPSDGVSGQCLQRNQRRKTAADLDNVPRVETPHIGVVGHGIAACELAVFPEVRTAAVLVPGLRRNEIDPISNELDKFCPQHVPIEDSTVQIRRLCFVVFVRVESLGDRRRVRIEIHGDHVKSVLQQPLPVLLARPQQFLHHRQSRVELLIGDARHVIDFLVQAVLDKAEHLLLVFSR